MGIANLGSHARCFAVVVLGLSIPVVPGIMPITSSTQLMRFSDACGAEIPRWIRLRLQSYGDDVASIKAVGLDVSPTCVSNCTPAARRACIFTP